MSKEVDNWTGCYDSGWQDLIIPESFSHPAKFSYNLIERMTSHAIRNGWITKGSVVVDPFGGVGCGGIVAAYSDLVWIGVELEEKFVDLGRLNFGLHQGKLAALGCPQPVIIQGDSRNLYGLLRVAKVVDNLDIVISSPPFQGAHKGCATDEAYRNQKNLHQSGTEYTDYGQTPGNLGNLKPGDVDAIVSSPPFEKCLNNAKMQVPHDSTGNFTADYGNTNGNIGNQQGDTFWQAAKEIVRQCHQILKPGGHAIWVVKAFVRKGKIVDFPGDWERLCESVGFETVCRHRAMLVKETVENGLFENISKISGSKSFFRRLGETKAAWKKYWQTIPSEHERAVWKFRASLMSRLWSEPVKMCNPLAMCFQDSGEDERDWNKHIRIDFEMVLCMRKLEAGATAKEV